MESGSSSHLLLVIRRSGFVAGSVLSTLIYLELGIELS